MKFTNLKQFFVSLLFFPSFILAQLPAKMIQYPDVSNTKICFTYGDDLWIADKSGGPAYRLTTTEGRETKGKFSPDGKTLAFNANYDGNNDIYTIPIIGGIPQRITTHGMSEDVKGWSNDGKSIIFTSSMESGKQRFTQAYIVSVNGGLPSKMPMEKVSELDIHTGGDIVAMTDKSRLSRTWKRYRGGTAPDIYLLNLKTMTSENITNNDANNELPMWNGDDLYYLSDQDKNKKFNIWKYNLNTKKHNQVTFDTNFDIRYPSMGNNEIVYEAGGKLYILNLKSNKSNEVNVSVVGDFTTLKPTVKKVSNYIENINISPDGNRVVIEARGDIFSVPKKDGITQNLTHTSGVAERYPSWSPDGKYIAYWSDKSGEYELTIRDLKNKTERQIGNEGPGYRYNIYWSPDSKKMVFVDQEMNIKMADIDKNSVSNIDKENSLFEGGLRNFSASWSSDSRYITYANTHENQNSQICVFDTKVMKKEIVTSAFFNDNNPVFSADDKFIFCTTDRDFSPIYSDYDNSWVYPNSTKLAMIPLDGKIKNPIEIKNDTVAIKVVEEKKKDDEGEKKDDEKEKDDQDKVEFNIDFNNIESRLTVLPIELGNSGGLAVSDNKIVYLKAPSNGSKSEKMSLKYYDFEADEEKGIIDDVNGFKVSANKKSILVFNNKGGAIIEIAPNQSIENPIDMSKMEMTINPKEEWRQIFNDVWRFERDFFYDKNMHGVDWPAMKEKYGSLVEHAASRYDLNFIIGELIGEMNASHTYRGGGDSENAQFQSAGYLGVDWKMENGKYRIKNIIEAAPWDTEVKSPLKDAGLDISNGDYVLAINGINLTNNYDPNQALQGKAGNTTELTISKTGNEEDAFNVLVKPLNDETRLRNLSWIEKNRKYVDEKSGGRIGYIYVPSTGRDGQEELVRMYYAQHHKDGLIIDERFNNGGQIPDRFVELLNRPVLAYFKVRTGKDWAWPPKAHYGPKAMLINGWSGSGGDAFPDFFKKRGLGPLVGTRTWGGLIGISGAPSLIDGGGVTVPTFRMYHPDGTWFEEGHGVEPDFEVPENPGQEAKGIDVQLDKSIELVMKSLKEMDKMPKQKVPSPENRSK